MSTNEYFDLSCVFASKLVLEDEMAGRVTAQSKEISASVSKFFEDERQRGWRIQVSYVVGRTASTCRVSKQSVNRARRLSRKGVDREGEDGREEEDTKVFSQKAPQLFFYFLSYFLHSHIKKIAMF